MPKTHYLLIVDTDDDNLDIYGKKIDFNYLAEYIENRINRGEGFGVELKKMGKLDKVKNNNKPTSRRK